MSHSEERAASTAGDDQPPDLQELWHRVCLGMKSISVGLGYLHDLDLTPMAEDDADEVFVLFERFAERLDGVKEEFASRAMGRREYVRQREQLAAAMVEVERFAESLMRNAG